MISLSVCVEEEWFTQRERSVKGLAMSGVQALNQLMGKTRMRTEQSDLHSGMLRNSIAHVSLRPFFCGDLLINLSES